MRHLVVTGDEFQEREDVVENPSLGESMLGIFQKQQQEPLRERERCGPGKKEQASSGP